MVKKLKAEEIDIESLEQQYKAICDKLTEVRGLLEKADAKRVEPGEDRVKWNKVIDNLERSLIDLRSKESKLNSELRIARQILRDARVDGGGGMVVSSSEVAAPEVAVPEMQLPESKISVASQVQLKKDTAPTAPEAAPEKDGAAQLLLQTALAKLRSGQMEGITLKEVKLLMTFKTVLERRESKSKSEVQVLELIAALLKDARRLLG